ncbi:MAG: SpoIIE family protein phosphatase [Planctomycetota bacterium]|nr:SpoIIE family protein phosphatase [Planctomycetota bacterium]
MSGQERSRTAWLVALCGPGEKEIELRAKEGGISIGRHEQCEIRLAAETVSRFHARLRWEVGGWRIADLKSRWGTFLNGCRLDAGGAEMPLREGDLIRITPWTFSFTSKARGLGGVESVDDVRQMQTMVRSVGSESSGGAMADDLLALLLESAAGMHAAADEPEMAEVMLEAAIRGTGLPNGAVLRPLDAEGRVEVVASRRSTRGGKEGAAYSRALLAAASGGVVAELSPMNAPVTSESIVQMRIETAICVPLMLGSAVAAYLYLDSRGERGMAALKMRGNASAFCVGLGRIAGLALANLKRVDIERRQAMIEAELAAGAEAQRWILPRREDRVGRFEYVGESRPGRGMGGDFFDVIQLDENRVAVAVGDVSGKGVAASVLMTAAQGFLHAALKEDGRAEKAVGNLNRFVMPRRPVGKFITMWVGVFDAGTMTLRYVDAGHGYGMMVGADGKTRVLSGEEGMPVGVSEDAIYVAETVALAKGAGVLVISDGIVEQPGLGAEGAAGERRCFGMVGVRECLARICEGEDEVGRLFEAVKEHAGTGELADDATVVMVRW